MGVRWCSGVHVITYDLDTVVFGSLEGELGWDTDAKVILVPKLLNARGLM